MSNITKISLRGKTVVDSKPLYQYDYGQKIRFIGVSLPAAYEVHFSNYEQGESVTVLATSDEVDIPDFLLQSGYDIYVWVYIHTGVSDGETEYQITIPVIERARPTNQEPTPQEQDIITETIAALNDAVTEARDIAEDVTEKDEHVTQLYTYMNNTKNEVYQYKEDAETAANLLKNVSANAETLPPSSDATATYSSGVFNFGIPRGEPGKNFVIKKYVATVEDLPENVEVGTVYGVGTSQPYSIYVFSENLGWVDNGFVQGPQGLPGEKGEAAGFGTPTVTVNQTIGQPYASISTRGPDTAKIFDFAFSGLKGEKGDTGNGISSVELNNDYTLTLNYTDGTSYTTEESIRGDTGENGTTFMPSLTSDGILSWSNDGGKINPRSVNIKGPQGERGPAGEGIPTGGTAGQVLKKVSDTDFDTEWDDATGIPASDNPLMDGVASVGVSEKYAREDHVHPTDTSLFSLDMDGAEIPQGANLNNYKTFGNYYCNDASIVATLSNCPIGVGFKMVIIRNQLIANGACVQIIFPVNQSRVIVPVSSGGITAGIFYRTYTPSMWSHWVGVNNYYDLSPNDDLNNCKNSGTYMCRSAVNADTILNGPVTDTMYSVITVNLSDISGHLCQIAFILPGSTLVNSNGAILFRFCFNSIWSPWKNISDAATVNGHTVESDVPANAVFTDTTYESKQAVANGTEVSLVTTGEKSTWNNKADKSNIVSAVQFRNSDYQGKGIYYIKNSTTYFVVGMASSDQDGLMSADDYRRILNSQPQPVKLKLISNSDYSYQDSPTGPFSVNTDYTGDISDIYLAQNVKLTYGTINLNSTGTPQYNEEYRLVSAANSNGETPVITLTFRTISMRNGTPVIKTVIVEQETGAYNLNNAIVTYSETVL